MSRLVKSVEQIVEDLPYHATRTPYTYLTVGVGS
jgi:hypothetical protein